MTRKILIIFSITFILSLLIFIFIFGKNGLFHTHELKKEINQLEYTQRILNVKVNSLKEQSSKLSEGEGVKDIAFKLGYQMEGEQVYYFNDNENKSVTATNDEEAAIETKARIESLPLWSMIVSALSIALFAVILYTLRLKTKRGGQIEK